MLQEYVRGGGALILTDSVDSATNYSWRCGSRDEDLRPRAKPPNFGAAATVVNSAKLAAFAACKGASACAAARKVLWAEVQTAMAKRGAQPSVALSGVAQASTSLNAWRHGAGPMLSVHLTNYSPQNVGNVTITLSTGAASALGAAPVAWLLSLDTAGAPPRKLAVAGEGSVRVSLRFSVHVVVLFASSDAEFRCREAGATARKALTGAVLAYRSSALRSAADDGADVSNFIAAWTTVLEADVLLSALSSPMNVTAAWYEQVGTYLTSMAASMTATMADIRNFAKNATRRVEQQTASMCAGDHGRECLAALDFHAATSPAANFSPLGTQQLYNPKVGYGWLGNTSTSHVFENAGVAPLHRSGIWNAKRSSVRVDVDVGDAAVPPRSLILTLVLGFHDIGSAAVSRALGINSSTHNCRVSGTPFNNDTCTRDRNFFASHAVSAWTGIASTGVSVSVNGGAPNDCMLGAYGHGPGFFLTRSCRIQLSHANQQSSKLRLDITLAPDNGTSGCFSHACGVSTFAWLVNALVLQLPTATMSPRAAASLAASDRFALSAMSEFSWLGPFDNEDATGMETVFPVEADLAHWPLKLSQRWVGKHEKQLGWRNFTASPTASAPHLPLSRLLPTRADNTGSAAFAVAFVKCLPATNTRTCNVTLHVGMSGRGSVSVLSATRPVARTVLVDDLISGLSPDEAESAVTLDAGRNALVIKSASTFSADAVAIDGKRSLMFGMEARDVPNNVGVIRDTNEWSVSLAVQLDTPNANAKVKTDDAMSSCQEVEAI